MAIAGSAICTGVGKVVKRRRDSSQSSIKGSAFGNLEAARKDVTNKKRRPWPALQCGAIECLLTARPRILNVFIIVWVTESVKVKSFDAAEPPVCFSKHPSHILIQEMIAFLRILSGK